MCRAETDVTVEEEEALLGLPLIRQQPNLQRSKASFIRAMISSTQPDQHPTASTLKLTV